MALEIYRSATEDSIGFDRYSELCRDCAAEELKNGFYVEYDLYLSEKTDAVSTDCTCEKCERNTFFIDGRKKWNKLEGAIY